MSTLEQSSARTADAHRAAALLKGAGYLTSIISVALLGIVSLKSALDDPGLMPLLLTGMGTSVVGMLLRWMSFRREQAEKARRERGRSGGD